MTPQSTKLYPEPPHLEILDMDDGEEWFSVILHFSDANLAPPETLKDAPPISNRFELSDAFWIERLDSSLASAIINACSPANFGMPIVQQQDHTYAFVKKAQLPGVFSDFGGLEDLSAAAALSRLIHFTNTGLRYAARVSTVHGRVKHVLAYQPRGVSVDVFGSNASKRNWLTESDARRREL